MAERARSRSPGTGRRARAPRSFPSLSAEHPAMCRARALLVSLMIGVTALAPGLAAGQAGGELTVDEIVARALTDNPDLKAARIDVEAATARVQQAGLRPDPRLG